MEEQRVINEEIAIKKMGLSYVKIPRFILNRMRCESSRQLGMLHLMLFETCLYADGAVKFKGRKLQLKRGEYVGTQQDLSDLTGISIGSVNRLIRRLEAEQLITVTRIQGGSLIRVNGYTTLIGEPAMPDKKEKYKRKKAEEDKRSVYEAFREAEEAMYRRGARRMPDS